MKEKKTTTDLPEKKSFSESSFWIRISVQLTFKDKLNFIRYVAVLLKSGLAIDDAIEILHQQSKGSLNTILNGLSNALKRGDTLADGLEEFPHVFDPIIINLIKAGEASGTLQGNLEHLVDQMKKDYDLKQKVRGAMIYPAIIILAAISISVGIIVFILPNITGIFDSLRIELPLPTKILLWTSGAISEHGFITLLAAIGLFVAFLFIRKIRMVQPVLHRMILFIPLFGNMTKMLNIARFTRLTGTMVKSGMSIDEVIPIAVSVIKNANYKSLFLKIQKAVTEGETMTSVLEQHPHLVPPMATRVIYVGEQSGTLEEMMLYVADFYQQEIDDITHNLSTLLEPFLLIMIGLMVGGLALSILMPIYQVIGNF